LVTENINGVASLAEEFFPKMYAQFCGKHQPWLEKREKKTFILNDPKCFICLAIFHCTAFLNLKTNTRILD